MKTQLVVLGMAALTLAACTRENPAELTSGITIKMPSKGDLQGTLSNGFPDNVKVCFGVQVSASDIPQSQVNSCAPAVGQTAGFVGEGETLSISVQKGSARRFELMAYLGPADQPCPQFNAAFLGDNANQLNTYSVGKTDPIDLSKEEEVVAIPYKFPGVNASVASTIPASSVCASTAGLKGYVTASGDVYDGSSVPNPALSSPINEALFMTGLPDARAIGRVTTSGVLNLGSSSEATIPEWLHSLTRKPDTGKYYALDDEGTIYEVSILSAGTSIATPASVGTCPFATTGCRVPAWMQSISAGYGTQLYGLDQGGQVYSLGSSGPAALSVLLGEHVTQVAFY